jgi:hypothetical protein
MLLNGLKISRPALQQLMDGVSASSSPRGKCVTQVDLVTTHNPSCRCDDPDHMGNLSHTKGHLYAGMPVSGLRALNSGCTPRWVCSRLDSLRRRHVL